MARFLVDAQLPPALAQRLREAGHDAEHVNALGLGAAPDRIAWSRAGATGSILVTKDIDFMPLVGRQTSVPAVVWVRLGNVTNVVLWAVFGNALPAIVTAIENGERIVELR